MRRFYTYSVILALLLALTAPITTTTAIAESLGVACAAPEAAEAALKIAELGGNAVDSAVAAALVLAVVHPQAGNLGGGGFAIVKCDNTVKALDFREVAPAAATREMYLHAPPDASLVGPLAAGVPGTPFGLYELHRRYGRLPWPQVVLPAWSLASGGFVVSKRLSEDLARSTKLLARFPSSRNRWMPDGKPLKPGTLLVLPRLAATLERFAAEGPDIFRSGPLAEKMVSEIRSGGGLITVSDFAGYKPVWREPVRFKAFGWDVASMGLPSSGGIILGQAAGILEHAGYSASLKPTQRYHLIGEALKLAFSDRVLLGDPCCTEADATQLLNRHWIDLKAKLISLGSVLSAVNAPVWGRKTENRETTHLSVASDNCAVSITLTLNGNFGCGLWLSSVGFFLNNEMDDFTTKPGQPNLYGLVQGKANEVGPGKRMLSSMSPTVAWRGDRVLVLGSPGGSRIPSATLQVFLNVAVLGMDLKAAVSAPRVHHQLVPDVLEVEAGRTGAEAVASLMALGHKVKPVEKIGEVNVVGVGGGVVEAAGDPRGPCYGAVFEGGGK